MQGSMKAVVLLAVTLLVALAALTYAGTSVASTGWRDFNAEGLMCSSSRPGQAQSALCLITDGTLEGYSFSLGSWGIKVKNARERVVFKKTNTGSEKTPGWKLDSSWQYKNEATACKRLQYVVSCFLTMGKLEGWAVLVTSDSIEISDLDNITRFARGDVQ